MNYVAIDFENFYDKEISITTMGGYNYTRHPKTRPYMVSAAASTGHTFVGVPDDFDFAAVSGPNWQWIHHNASYDPLVYQRLHEENPEAFPLPANPPQCSADLCAFVGLPRSLAGAVSAAYGVELSKSVRDKMKGKMPEDLTAEEQADLRKYALDDAKWCLKLWMDFSPKWPKEERDVSLMTREMGWGGLPLNQEKVEEAKLNLQRRIWEARNKIPWAETAAALSPKQLAIACREAGIPCPPSLALDSEECAAWEDQYGEHFPWVDAMRTVRRCNALLKKLESMEARLMPNRRMNYDLKYVGAHTKRWSGGGGVNCQNLSSKELFGVDLRSMIEAPEGKTFIVADLSQIEPRCGALICKDWPFLASLAAGVSPYIIHARQTMGLGPDEVWPKNDIRYKLAKARCVAGDTPVLTSRGYVEICEVTVEDTVWDGIGFVHHEGIIRQPYKTPITLDGIQITEDHPVFIAEQQTLQAGDIQKRKHPAHLFRGGRSCGNWREVWELARLVAKIYTECAGLCCCAAALHVRILWERAPRTLEQLKTRAHQAVRTLWGTVISENPGQGELGEGNR